MRTALFILLFLFTLAVVTAQDTQHYFNKGFNQDEDFKFVGWVDPTFTDGGFQFGLGIRKELGGGWVGIELSAYPQLEVSYWDIVGQGGLAFNFGKWDVLGGARIGRSEREGNPYPLVGIIAMMELNLSNTIAIGFRLWVDHREDQKDEFYGDEDNYEPGLIFKGPLAQENGAVVLTIKIN